MRTLTLFGVVLVIISGLALAGESKANMLIIRLVKPDIISVNGQVVSEAQLRTMINRSGKPILIQLDPEVRLSTLHSVNRVLSELKPKNLKMEGDGRWILEAIIHQRSEKVQSR